MNFFLIFSLNCHKYWDSIEDFEEILQTKPVDCKNSYQRVNGEIALATFYAAVVPTLICTITLSN